MSPTVHHLNTDNCTALRNLTLKLVTGISLAETLRIISPNCRLHRLIIEIVPDGADCEWESAARILDEQQFLTLREFMLEVLRDEGFAEEEKWRISDCLNALRRRGVKVMLSFGQEWFNTLEPYHGDSLAVSACQSKTPELQVEDGQLSGVPLTSNADVHQSSI
ncbi:hypothetical protein BKA93DRAFT_855863 [Sparassis latifolia]